MKKTNAQKLTWLRKNHVILKKEKVRASTVNRLYSFYQRNPLSTPRNLAYGLPGRIQKKFETEDGKITYVYTPKGKITTKQYIKLIDTRTNRQIKRELPVNISTPKFSHRFKSGKREDRFRYVFEPYLKVTALNVNDVLARLKKIYIPDLMETVDLFYKRRKIFYQTRVIGALILYDTENMPEDNLPRPVKFSTKQDFPGYLWDMLHELLVTDILRNYKDAIINLKCIDVFIRTQIKPSNIEKLL